MRIIACLRFIHMDIGPIAEESRPNLIELLAEQIAYEKVLLSIFLWLPAKISYKMHAFWQVFRLVF